MGILTIMATQPEQRYKVFLNVVVRIKQKYFVTKFTSVTKFYSFISYPEFKPSNEQETFL